MARTKGRWYLWSFLAGCLIWLFAFSAGTAWAATADYDGAAQAIIAAMENYEGAVNIEKYNIPSTSSATTELSRIIQFDYPQYFQYNFVGSSFSYSYGSSIMKSVSLDYDQEYSASEISKMRKAYEERIAEILSHVDSGWADFEKILYVNDWLSVNCDYGYLYDTFSYNSYGAIVLGHAVCEGYSRAFKDLMNRLGIDCNIIKTSSHAWNVVKLGSKWYHVDVTFNNPDPTGYSQGSADHKYLLLSRSAMSSVSSHTDTSDWDYMSSVTVGNDTDTTYDNYFWANVSRPFFYYNGYWYGLIPQGSSRVGEYAICQYKGTSTGLTYQKTVKTLSEDSYRSSELASWVAGSYYDLSFSGNYTGFAACGKYLYYSTPHAIYSLNVSSGATELVYELTSSQKKSGYIDGISVDGDGVLSYDLLTGYDGNRIFTTKTIQAHTHSYTSRTTATATFVSTGTKVYTCSSCGQTYTEEIAKVTCKKGQTYTVENYTYKIVSAKTDGTGTVAFTGLAKSVTAVKVAKTVKILGASFQITQISASALKSQTKITSVSVGANVATIGANAFYGCTKLKTVTGCTGVTSIGSSAFYNCKALTTVKGCASVTKVGNKAFYKCVKLTRVGSTKSTVTIKKVKTIGTSAFRGCTAVKKVNLTSTALTTLGASSFRGCTAMTSFTSKSTKLKSIGKAAFYGDKKLATITLKTTKLTSSNVKANAFKGIKSTCTFKVPSSKAAAYKKLFQARGAGKKIKTS